MSAHSGAASQEIDSVDAPLKEDVQDLDPTSEATSIQGRDEVSKEDFFTEVLNTVFHLLLRLT